MTTANEIRLFDYLDSRAKDMSLRISLSGEKFDLTSYDGLSLGYFGNLDHLAQYIYGYEAGHSAGRCDNEKLYVKENHDKKDCKKKCDKENYKKNKGCKCK